MTPDKDPSLYPIATYVWVLVLSFWGGAVSFLRKVKRGQARPFNLVELIGELVTSGLVGVITFWLTQAAGISLLLSAALIGIASHMGSRAIFVFERQLERTISKLFGMDITPQDRLEDHQHVEERDDR